MRLSASVRLRSVATRVHTGLGIGLTGGAFGLALARGFAVFAVTVGVAGVEDFADVADFVGFAELADFAGFDELSTLFARLTLLVFLRFAFLACFKASASIYGRI